MGVIGVMAFSEDMRSLLDKLDALELTEGERAAFGELLGVEEIDDVEGFADLGLIRVQGFRIFDTDPLDGTTRRGFTVGQPGPAVVDHKADD